MVDPVFDGAGNLLAGGCAAVGVDLRLDLAGHEHPTHLKAVPVVGIVNGAGPAAIGVNTFIAEGLTDGEEFGVVLGGFKAQIVEPVDVVVEEGGDEAEDDVVITAAHQRFTGWDRIKLVDPFLAAGVARRDVGVRLVEVGRQICPPVLIQIVLDVPVRVCGDVRNRPRGLLRDRPFTAADALGNADPFDAHVGVLLRVPVQHLKDLVVRQRVVFGTFHALGGRPAAPIRNQLLGLAHRAVAVAGRRHRRLAGRQAYP